MCLGQDRIVKTIAFIRSQAALAGDRQFGTGGDKLSSNDAILQL
jgi:hypothetical protein